jgi:hypothetical protein
MAASCPDDMLPSILAPSIVITLCSVCSRWALGKSSLRRGSYGKGLAFGFHGLRSATLYTACVSLLAFFDPVGTARVPEMLADDAAVRKPHCHILLASEAEGR